MGIGTEIDPALLSATSALIGALIGGGASLTAAIYTQRYQDRPQRVARETTKRETVYADFIMNASKLLLNAYVHEGITLNGDEQHLIGLANRMRLFAPPYRDLVEAERGAPEIRDGGVVHEPSFRSPSTVQAGLPGGPG